MTDASPDSESLIDQHRSLGTRIREIQDFLETPRPPIGEEGFQDWVHGLSERLVGLYDVVSRHFRREETCGVLEQLEREHPRTAGRVQALRTDHHRILDDLRAIVSATLTYGGGRYPENPQLRRWTASVLVQLAEHEEEETDLFQRVHHRDLGAGD